MGQIKNIKLHIVTDIKVATNTENNLQVDILLLEFSWTCDMEYYTTALKETCYIRDSDEEALFLLTSTESKLVQDVFEQLPLHLRIELFNNRLLQPLKEDLSDNDTDEVEVKPPLQVKSERFCDLMSDLLSDDVENTDHNVLVCVKTESVDEISMEQDEKSTEYDSCAVVTTDVGEGNKVLTETTETVSTNRDNITSDGSDSVTHGGKQKKHQCQ